MECVSAKVRSKLPAKRSPESLKIFLPYSSKYPGSVKRLCAVARPLSSASAAITGLIDEPGG